MRHAKYLRRQAILATLIGLWYVAPAFAQTESWPDGKPSTTLLDQQLNLLEFQHGFQIVRMRHKKVGGQNFGNDRASHRQRR